MEVAAEQLGNRVAGLRRLGRERQLAQERKRVRSIERGFSIGR
jgi:hypothetical protein